MLNKDPFVNWKKLIASIDARIAQSRKSLEESGLLLEAMNRRRNYLKEACDGCDNI